MRVLLDNCVPRAFGKHLKGHFVRHASTAGLADLSNGDLLAASSAEGFDVLLTVDRHIAEQQNIESLPVAVIVIYVHSNTVPFLLPHLAAVHAVLDQRLQRRVYAIGA